jgi:hypothetical protein
LFDPMPLQMVAGRNKDQIDQKTGDSHEEEGR